MSITLCLLSNSILRFFLSVIAQRGECRSEHFLIKERCILSYKWYRDEVKISKNNLVYNVNSPIAIQKRANINPTSLQMKGPKCSHEAVNEVLGEKRKIVGQVGRDW